MPADPDALLRVHAGAVNGHVADSLAGHYSPQSRCIRDGKLVGEGADALRALQAEYGTDVLGRVMDVDGQQALVGWSGPEGQGSILNIVRMRSAGGRVLEVRIDHDAKLIERLANSTPRP
ncbi:MAG TPA: hypothetical protein VM286_01195 [Candidatus Thermoplasmatota archaeon]|nr:hypothetical protein [Candidatus Thermoplasmatota archaeon]